MLYGNINFSVNLDFPLIRAKCISHNRIYKDKKCIRILILGNLEPEACGCPNSSPFSFHPLNNPSKAKTRPFSHGIYGPPTSFSSESKVLQLAKRVLRVRLSSIQVQRECSPAILSARSSLLGVRCVCWAFEGDGRCQGACSCKSVWKYP